MLAQQTTIEKIFTGEKILIIPKYQRRYSWDRRDWSQLWRAVKNQYDADGDGPSHFIGSVVIAQRDAFPTEASNYDVIDGQQRLTTLLVLLAAIASRLPAEDRNRKRVESYMRNSFEEGEFEYKVRPGEYDRENLHAILALEPAGAQGPLRSAFDQFTKWIGELAVEYKIDYGALVRAATKRLEVVQILSGPDDNAHRIFQTLNSTGKELKAVDLLRNHFFMLLPTRVDQAYDGHWRPIELLLGEQFAQFLWTDIVTRRGLESTPNETQRIYAEWQRILDPMAGSEERVLEELRELQLKAESFAQMRSASTGEVALDSALRRLIEWGVAVHQPLTFAVLSRWRRREATTLQAARAIEYIESFLVRRMLVGMATNNLNRLFTTSVGQLATEAFAHSDIDVAVHRILSQPGKYWPADETVQIDGPRAPFYLRQRFTQRSFVLRRLEESFTGKYAPDWAACKFTVEHVLPQSPTVWWLKHLADADPDQDPNLIHADLVHTIGNLTLTCENPELGQMTLEQKRIIYRADGLKMNDGIADEPRWTRTEILERSRDLLVRACKIWVSPMPEEKQDDHALATEARTVLERLGRGIWVDEESLAEYMEADIDSLRRALILLGSDPLAALVLTRDGELPAWRSGTDREAAAVQLVEAGVFEHPHATTAAAASVASFEAMDTMADA